MSWRQMSRHHPAPNSRTRRRSASGSRTWPVARAPTAVGSTRSGARSAASAGPLTISSAASWHAASRSSTAVSRRSRSPGRRVQRRASSSRLGRNTSVSARSRGTGGPAEAPAGGSAVASTAVHTRAPTAVRRMAMPHRNLPGNAGRVRAGGIVTPTLPPWQADRVVRRGEPEVGRSAHPGRRAGPPRGGGAPVTVHQLPVKSAGCARSGGGLVCLSRPVAGCVSRIVPP